MKLLVAGSRSIEDFDLAKYIPAETTCIISGGARGVDALAEKYADEHRLSKIILRPQYARYGKGAPLKRNEEALLLADRVLVVWDGISRGTRYTLRRAEEMEKPVILVTISTQKNTAK